MATSKPGPQEILIGCDGNFDPGPYFKDPEKVPIDHRVEILLDGGIKRYMHDGEEDEPDYSTVIEIAGSPMLYIATNAKQFELMDELAKVASKIGNIDYLINAIKRLPL